MSDKTVENPMRYMDKEIIELRKDFDIHKDLQDERWNQITEVVKKNSESTDHLARSMERMSVSIDAMAGVMQLYQNVTGAKEIGVGMVKFVAITSAWLTGIAVCAAAIISSANYIISKVAL